MRTDTDRLPAGGLGQLFHEVTQLRDIRGVEFVDAPRINWYADETCLWVGAKRTLQQMSGPLKSTNVALLTNTTGTQTKRCSCALDKLEHIFNYYFE